MIFKSLSIKLFLIGLISYSINAGTISQERSIRTGTQSVVPVLELVQKNGYACEEHTVTTKDGYILTLHRIPAGLKEETDVSEKKPTVLLEHGAFTSSASWVLNTPENSLAFALADSGFDVWLGNTRGNIYANKHVTLDPSSSDFWNFTLDEVARYDIPATVDYIHKVTRKVSKLPLRENVMRISKPTEEGFEAEYEKEKRIRERGQQPIRKDQSYMKKIMKSIGETLSPVSPMSSQSERKSHETRKGGMGGVRGQTVPQSQLGGMSGIHSGVQTRRGGMGGVPSGVQHQMGGIRGESEWMGQEEEREEELEAEREEELEAEREEELEKELEEESEFNPENFGQRQPFERREQRTRMGPRNVQWKSMQRADEDAIFYIGFAQNSLTCLMQLARDPSLASKIKLFVGIGTIGTAEYAHTPLIKMLKTVDIDDVFKNEMILTNPEERFDIFDNLCTSKSNLAEVMFGEPEDFFYFLSGESKHIERKKIPFYLNNLLSGTSKNLMMHFSQIAMNNRIQSFDYSKVKKGIMSMISPMTGPESTEYDLGNVHVPVVLIAGEIDAASPPQDNEFFVKTLPNVVDYEVIKGYGHYDFLLGNNCETAYVDKLIKLLEE